MLKAKRHIQLNSEQRQHLLEITSKGKAAAYLVVTACSEALAGRSGWTMQLLADRLVQLKLVESISDETVRHVLKKTNSSRG